MSNPSMLTLKRLKRLATFESDVCLTLTMPCVVAGDQEPQNSIRFKNVLQEAEVKLRKIGWSSRKIAELLQPAQQLLKQSDFHSHQEQGLLVCLADNFFEHYQLPFSVDVNVVVDRHFYLRQIIPHVLKEQDVAVLLLDRNSPALVIHSLNQSEPEIVHPPRPYTSFDEYMKIYELDKSLQFRSQGYAGGAYRTMAGYHGQGLAGDQAIQKGYLKEYIKRLENWVSETLAQYSCKDVYCVALPESCGLYKEAVYNGHPALHILAQANPGSYDLSHWIKEARQMQKRQMEEERGQFWDTYRRVKNKHSNLVEETIPNILKAAHNRRVDTLILPDISQDYCWGRFEAASQEVEQQDSDDRFTRAGDELVNLAVIKTFLNGGNIVTFPGTTRPRYSALCRW